MDKSKLNHIRIRNSEESFCGFNREVSPEGFDLSKDTCTECVIASVEHNNQNVEDYNALANVVVAAVDTYEHMTKVLNENLQNDRVWRRTGNPVFEEEKE